MCAIFGWNGTISNTILRTLFENSLRWGPHAAGIAWVEDGKQLVFKKAGLQDHEGRSPALKLQGVRLLLRNHNHRVERASDSTIGLGHTRFKTHGPNSDACAHPFTFKKSSDELVFAHNGILHNYRNFAPKAVVDSECLGPLLHCRQPGLAQGSCGVVWLQENKLYAYRRNQHLHAVTGISPVDGNPLTVVATSVTISRFIFGDEWTETELEEGVAYLVNPGEVVEVWSDRHISTNRRYGIHTGL